MSIMSGSKSKRSRLVDCTHCGGKHYAGSTRSRECSGVSVAGKGPFANRGLPSAQEGLLAAGEFSRVGDGPRFDNEPRRNLVFESWSLPKNIKSEATTDPRYHARNMDKETANDFKLAAKSAVAEFVRRGAVPTQATMSDIDITDEELELMLVAQSDYDKRASEDMSQRTGAPVSVHAPSSARCAHATRTIKGLAVSPVALHRLMARHAPGVSYGGGDLVDVSIGLRAIAAREREVHEILSLGSSAKTEDLQALSNLMTNLSQSRSGSIARRSSGRQSFRSDDLGALNSSSYTALRDWMSRVDYQGSPCDNMSGAPALPEWFSRELIANDLTWEQWKEYGLEGKEGTCAVAVEPAAVRMRVNGTPDNVLFPLFESMSEPDSKYELEGVFRSGIMNGCDSVRAGSASLDNTVLREAEALYERHNSDFVAAQK